MSSPTSTPLPSPPAAAGASGWRSPASAAPPRLPATVKCNSLVVSPAGQARKGADRTEAQRAAAARNLLHQPVQGPVADELPADGVAVAVPAGRNGYMSKATRATVKTLVDTLLFMSELPEARKQTYNAKLGYNQQACYPTFVTLTLPAAQLRDEAGELDDEHAKRQLLRPFLQRLQYKFGCQCFIWVAEPQLQGNIHFHLLIDKYIDNRKDTENEAKSQQLTKAWNEILAKHGYIAAYATAQRARHADGFAYDATLTKLVETFDEASGRYLTTAEAVSYADQVEAFAYGEATNWQNPNTADIHRLKSQNNVKGYICKYLTKNDGTDNERRKISGNLWGAADLLRDVKAYREEFGDDLRQALARMGEAVPGSVRVTLVTLLGNMTLEEYEDNDLAGQVPVLATIYTYSQKLFWRFCPPAFRARFQNYYREAFRRIYLGGAASPVATKSCRAGAAAPPALAVV